VRLSRHPAGAYLFLVRPQSTTPERRYGQLEVDKFKALDPFFNIVMKGLDGLVDGDHFWDAVADKAVFEFLYRICDGFTKMGLQSIDSPRGRLFCAILNQ